MRQNSSRSKWAWNLKIGTPIHTVKQNKTASTYDVKNCLDSMKLYKIHEAIHYSPVICKDLINSQGGCLWVHSNGTNDMHAQRWISRFIWPRWPNHRLFEALLIIILELIQGIALWAATYSAHALSRGNDQQCRVSEALPRDVGLQQFPAIP